MENKLTHPPINWTIKKLGDICFTTSGGTPNRKRTDFYGGSIPWVKSGELVGGIITRTEECITEEALQNSSAKIFPCGTLLIALYGATIGKLAFLGVEAATNQAVCGIYKCSALNQKYLYYFLSLQRPALIKLGIGGAQPNISQTILKEISIPYPPLPEQERIVARIEELFSDLDKGVETLQTIKAQLKVYRKAAISNCFEPAKPATITTLSKIADISGGITKGQRFSQDTDLISLPYLRVANVQDGYLDLHEIKEILLRAKDREKYTLCYGDVLYTEGGDRDKLGRGTIWRNQIPECVHQNHVFRARVDRNLALPEFVAYWSLTKTAKDYFYTSSKQTVNLASINKTVLSTLPIPLPAIDIQARIISQIESRLSVCDKIEQTVDESLAKAESLRQSILKKAFEGRL